MKKLLVLALISLLNVLPTHADTPELRLGKLRLGAVLPLTGVLATYGQEIKNGIELANQDQGSPAELFFEDAPPVGASVITALQKLIEQDKIDAITGNFSNSGMLAMSPILNRAQIPTLHSAAMDNDIIQASDWIVSTNIRVQDEAYHMAEYVFQTLHLKTAAVLSIQTSFGQGYRHAFIERL